MLRKALQPAALVFLAPESELLGEDWPTRLPQAIREAWVTLAIISRSTLAAHFQTEEILLAIKESRAGLHSVVPIRVATHGEIPPIPFGLNSKNCLDLHSGCEVEIDSIVDRLLATRDDIWSRAGLGWRTNRASINPSELSQNSSDPLRQVLERIKNYEQNGLLRESTVKEIQLILLKHHLIDKAQDS